MLSIEISDLPKLIYDLNKELSIQTHNLRNFLPIYIWNSILKYHLKSFHNLKCGLLISHNKKFKWLQMITEKEKIRNIKPINYFYHSNKRYTFTDIKDRNIANVNLNTNTININVNPDKFTEDEATLEHKR